MKQSALIALIRRYSGDDVEPYVVPDTVLASFINEAETEAAERAQYLRLDSTYDIAVTSGVSVYAINPSVIFIDSVRLSGESKPLIKTTRRELDFNINKWISEVATPNYYFQDDTKLTLYPMPDKSYTMQLEGSRRPIVSMETPSQYHDDLSNWCLFRFFSINNSGMTDVNKAIMYSGQFDKTFGHKRNALYDTVNRAASEQSTLYRNPFN
jgi:Holliday junction resolvase RusA-like endonuclease